MTIALTVFTFVIGILLSIIAYFLTRLISSIDSLKIAVDTLTINNAETSIKIGHITKEIEEIRLDKADSDTMLLEHEKQINIIKTSCNFHHHDKTN